MNELEIQSVDSRPVECTAVDICMIEMRQANSDEEGIILCKRCRERRRIRRWRADNPERTKEINRRSAAKPEAKQAQARYQREHLDTPAFQARRILGRAVKAGKVTKPAHCELCSCTDVVGHHIDYSRPLDVRWLCILHHGLEHRKPEVMMRLMEQAAAAASL